jgi:hypothetical protein
LGAENQLKLSLTPYSCWTFYPVTVQNYSIWSNEKEEETPCSQPITCRDERECHVTRKMEEEGRGKEGEGRRKQETGNRKQETRSGKQKAVSRKHKTEKRKQEN